MHREGENIEKSPLKSNFRHCGGLKYSELMRGELRGAGFVGNFQFSLEGEDQTITNYEIACKVDNTIYSAENNNF